MEDAVSGSVVLAATRTPTGRLLGTLKDFSGAELGGIAIKAALEKAGVRPDQVQYTIMGQVLTAGAGQMPARQAAVAAGIPMDIPALTVNKVCLSGLNAIALADQLIRLGEFDLIVAGGQESMTQAPHLLPRSRSGFRSGDVSLVDHMVYDGLFCAFDQLGMGVATEKYNSRYEGLTREKQDAFAAASHQRAAAAAAAGRFAEELAPVTIPQRKGDPVVVDTDEGVRPGTTVEILAKLPPVYSSDGTITAGSASQISDGAAAVVVASKAKAEDWACPGSRRSVPTAWSPDRTRACMSSRRTGSERRWPRRICSRATWTWWRSTRRSPRSASCPPSSWASARTS